MSWKKIKLIFLREVRDQLRDRRTLFMVAVLPLLLYPAMGIGMVQMTFSFTEQPRTVVVLGAEHLPQEPPLIDGGRIVASFFDQPADADKLEVVSDGDRPSDNSDPETAKQATLLLQQARLIRKSLVRREEFESAQKKAAASGAVDRIQQADLELLQIKEELARLFKASRIQVLMIIPDGFGNNITRINDEISRGELGKNGVADYPRPQIVQNSADDKSMIAYQRVTQALQKWESQILRQRLVDLDLPETLPEPVRASAVDLAEKSQIAANLWSKLFPALLVIMAVTGAFYPAVDLAAGEKERGTMETLLICPATRTELVIGKFLTVMLFSLCTALLNLISAGMTGKYMASIAGAGAFSKIGDLALPTPMAMVWVLILAIPLAALFSALCLALATFARSSKEGQHYLTPLLTVTMGLTVVCLSPAVEIEPLYSIMPVIGPALLLKELLATGGSAEALMYVVPVLVSSFGYSLLALWWAVDLFSREDVLFREAERFEIKIWLRHLLRDKEPTPSFTEAGICFVMIMFLQFGALKFMSGAMADPAGMSLDMVMMKLLVMQQLVIIATPALFMGILLTSSVRRTFRIRWPNWRFLAVAAALPLVLHPLSLELAARMQGFFPPLPKSIQDVAQTMTNPDTSIWFVLLAFAVIPAVCEEVAFRGFILSGFSRSKRTWLAIGLSSLTFGIMHMIPQQVFNATLLGAVLGLIAVRSKSLLPCLVFHAAYNSLEVLRSRFNTAWLSDKQVQWLATVEDGGLQYGWLTLVIAAVVAIVLLRWLVLYGRPASTSSVKSSPHSESLAEMA